MKEAINILRKSQKGHPFTIHSPGSEGDFHIHSVGANAGKPAKEPSATTYAVRSDPTVLDPKFLRYAFEHAHQTGRFKKYMRGSVIERVNVGDAHKAMVEHFHDLYGKK
jgi:hypothetical protein